MRRGIIFGVLLLLASFAVGQAGNDQNNFPGSNGSGGTISSGTPGQPGCYTGSTAVGSCPWDQLVAPDPQLEIFEAALRNSANQVVNIVIPGDSIAAGVGVTGGNHYASWAEQLAINLHARYGNHGSGLLPVSGSLGVWTITGAWTTNASLGPTQTGATAFSTLYTEASTAGGCKVTIDAAGQADTTNAVAGSFTPIATTYATTLGYHTLTIGLNGSADNIALAAYYGDSVTVYTATSTDSNANCYFYGAEWTMGTTGVSVHNVAVSGANSRAYGGAASTENAFLSVIPNGIHLAIISLGVNDYHTASYGITQSEYQTNLQNLITYVQGLSVNSPPSILILDEHIADCLIGDGFACSATLTQPLVFASEKALANTNSLAFQSLSIPFVSYATANAAGLVASDHVHPSNLGHAFYDQWVEQRIRKVDPPPVLQFDANSNMVAIGKQFTTFNGQYAGIPGLYLTLFGQAAGVSVNTTAQSISAFGNNAGSIFTTQQSGNAFGASACSSSGSSGLSAAATHVICLGDGAQVKQSNATQIGPGTNNTNGTLQFWSRQLADASGNNYTADGSFGSLGKDGPSACETSFGITTLATGATTTDTTNNCLPANSVIDAVVYRITTTITTAANFTIGDATIAGRFCAAQSTLTTGTTGICFVQADQTGTSGPRQVAAAKVRITSNVNPGAGAIRLIVYYHTWVAPTS